MRNVSGFIHALAGGRTNEGGRVLASPVRMMLLGWCIASIYGGAMGCFQLEWGNRAWLIAFGMVKVPLLLMATMGLCLPAFAAAATALGLGSTLREQVRAIMAGQAAFACALASMGPLTLVVYQSDVSHRWALLWNAAVFAAATVAAQSVIRRRFVSLVAIDRRHRRTLVLWMVLYALVGTQAGWMLRPFVGTPGMTVAFLREEPFSNAYVVVWELLVGTRGK